MYQVDGVKVVEYASFLGEVIHVGASVEQLGKLKPFSSAGKFVGMKSSFACTNPGAMVGVSDKAFLHVKKQEFKWKDDDEEENEGGLTGFEKASGGGMKVSNFMPCYVTLCDLLLA